MNPTSTVAPHFLRFARALALVSSATLVTGCAAAVEPNGDAHVPYDGTTGVDAAAPGIQIGPDAQRGIQIGPDATGVDAPPRLDLGIAAAPDSGRDGIAQPPDASFASEGGPQVPPEYPRAVPA